MEREVLEIVSGSREETFGWGRRLADLLEVGDVVALYGELGSGKTVFAQGVCEGLEVREYVTSPSFTLIHEYEGRIRVFHFDFYLVCVFYTLSILLKKARIFICSDLLYSIH